ncbi:pecanex-like protein 4 [Gigantopelta aegis]|uniref:pecanex-like protein 4 n=1 Tax=Gigantopelta aegis TaxID=1735272 RepID=UPI001B88E518|nr:pecanex-like protein 4 [Gigantopelta aegis]
MGNGVPLLNDYKQEFFWKRFPQTVLGGAKLRIGYDAPVYVYLNQIILWVVPWFLGGIFTIILELSYPDDEIKDNLVLYCSVYGSCMFVFVLVIQTISAVVQAQAQQEETRKLKDVKKKNIFSEEDEVEFDSCCGAETLEFVTPAKAFKVNIILHALVSGIMCGLTLWYLMPNSLNLLYGYNYGATVVLHLLGWVTLCIAQYSLTATSPPEPAIFRTMDVYEVTTLTRPFYVFLCITFHILNWYFSIFLVANQVMCVVFAVLPVLWVTGILPPIDALVLWLMEQVHVLLLGGSPMASGIRLLCLLSLSVGVFLGAYFIPSVLGTVILSACMGYILSTNLGGLGFQVWKSCRTKNRVSSSQNIKEARNPRQNTGFLWSWTLSTFLYHIIMVLLVGTVAATLNYFHKDLGADVRTSLGYVIIGLCVAEKVLRDAQNVCIVFGFLRNALFPHSTQREEIFKRRKKHLLVFGITRRILYNWISPLIMVAYLSLHVIQNDPLTQAATNGLGTSYAVWFTFGIVRAYRWVWQSTVHSLTEISIVHIVVIALPGNSIISTWGIPLLLLITGLCRDRFYQLLNKLYFFIVLLITSWTDKKQRLGMTATLIFLSLLFFPVVFAVITVAAILSAPLLPLFTLPLFFIGFPRPQKFWPEGVGASANVCSDSVYYKQFAPQFARSLRTAFANGSLGEPKPGNHYLVRFQDRLVWLMILERGAGFCTVNVKGLELQETSCHTAEAARLDDIFEMAFEKEGGFSPCSFNKYPMHTLTPVDSASVDTYSDARNVLTGVIDIPHSFAITMGYFVKSLVWLILQHVNKMKKREEKMKKPSLTLVTTKNENKRAEAMQEINHNHHTSDLNNKRNNDRVVPVKSTSIKNNLGPFENPSRPSSGQGPKTSRKSSVSSSIHSFTDSIWSDDFDAKISDNRKRVNVVRTSYRNMASSVPDKTGPKTFLEKTGQKTFDDDIEELFDELDFGFPAQDLNKPKPKVHTAAFSKPVTKKSSGNHIYKPVTNLAGSPDFKCQYSSHMSLPLKWRQLPIEYSQLSRHIDQFPVDWYRHVLSVLDWSVTGLPGEKVAIDVGADDALTNCYSQLIMACFSAFDVQGKPANANYLYKCYVGDVPWNAMMDWLAEDKELYTLVMKAYRYGFKLMIDHLLFGDISSNDELMEYLEEYDRDWYIGQESDPEWSKAVLDNTPRLFSLGHNTQQGTYISRTLSLQEVMVHIGRLNAEVVRGQWANLSVELLYLTNDDEERYSIQAHPAILRNLTVQAADPPLGYPIFSSEPITVPTL